MDRIANEAKLDGFAIGPSSVAGRWLAVHLLLSGSIAGLRRRLLFLLATSLRRLRAAARPFLALLRPSRTWGVLLSATLLAFLLRRFTDVRSRAVAAYRRRLLRKAMSRAATYEEWAKAAKKLEREVGSDGGALYDEELVGHELEELRQRRREGSVRDMAFYLRGDLVRNLGDMCNPQLHKGRLQVPKLISEYIEEVSTQLKMVCSSDDADGLLPEEKLTFVHETRHAFGRTALLLSGGACLGSFHVGVVRTLAKQKLLPRIIAGSSAGSIISAIASTRTDAELEGFFQSSLRTLRFFDALGGIPDVARRIATRGAVHEIRQLQALLREVTGNATFREAYRLTGRILAVTVSSPRPHERPRCLNYLTAPHVLIWSAVTASCAFPGLFPAQELMAKNRRGEVVPYQPAFGEGAAAARRWRDGSLDNDLPMEQLRELFNVNHFIVSQANPHIAPILRLKEFVRGYLGDFAAKIAQLVELEVKNRCNQILELRIPIGAGLAKLFAQEWEGDVTIVMPATLSQYLKIIQNPTYSDLMKASEQGRRCTWEKLSAIHSNCAIELALDDCAARLAHSRAALNRHAASLRGTLQLARRLSVAPRIPSWNTLSATLDVSDDEASRTPTPRSHLPASPQKGRAPWNPGDRGLPPRSPHATLPAEGEYALMERTSVGLFFDAAAKEEPPPRGRGRGQ